MSAEPLRVAVIGVGHLGRHHARILAAMPDVQLAGVVDTIPERAAEIAAATGSVAFTDHRDLFDRVDAVVVAVPTELHAGIAVPFLQQGTPVLVEKPMSRTLEMSRSDDRRGGGPAGPCSRRPHRAPQPGGRDRPAAGDARRG